VSFGVLDRAALGLVVAALAIWVVAPGNPLGGAALIAAGVASLVRLARWRGHLTLAEPLVWSLHLGFVWVGVGLLLVGLSAFLPDVPTAAGLHALTAGAMSGMTLAVMTRATLGHTGRLLTADRWTAAIYLLIAAAAALRVAAPFLADAYLPLLWTSGLAWSTAFGLSPCTTAACCSRGERPARPKAASMTRSPRAGRDLREPFRDFLIRGP
jgi:uncharacterized protein involved in response to NO